MLPRTLRHRLSSVLLVTVLAVAPCGVASAAGEDVTGDITPPTIAEVTASPVTVDVTDGPATVLVTARIADGASGVVGASLGYQREAPSGHSYGTFFERTSGTAEDGTYQARVVIPQGEAPGRWLLQPQARDRVGNVRIVQADELERSGQSGYLQVLNDRPDTTAPVVREVQLSAPTVNVEAASATLTVRMRITDEGTGTTFVYVPPQGPNRREGGVGVPTMTLVEGTPADGWWQGDVPVARYAHAGRWGLAVRPGDRVNNLQDVTVEQLAAAGIDSTFEVVSEQDVEAPVVTSASLSRVEVDVSDADQELTVSARVTDDRSGVEDYLWGASSIQLSLQHPLGQLAGAGGMPRTSGTALDGTYEQTFTIPRSSATGLWQTNLFVSDLIRNPRHYGAATAATVGLPPAVLVYNTPLPPVSVDVDPLVDGAVVDWAPPLDDRGAEVTDYIVRELPEGREVVVDAEARRAVVPDLRPDVQHSFVVHAVNRAGESDPSQRVEVTPGDQPAVDGRTTRLAGDDRIATALAVARAGYPDGSAEAVVLSRSDDYADALAGTALTAAVRGPLLTTPGANLDPRVRNEILRVLPARRTVYLLGGQKALSLTLEQDLQAQGYQVVRLAGADRYATAVRIAERTTGAPGQVLLATGRSFADALGAGTAAASVGGVVVLTDGARLPAVTADYLRRQSIHPLAVGGPAASAVPSAGRVVGRDRYETAVLLARRFPGNGGVVGLATGERFPDALAGGAHAARVGGPLLLTPRASLPAVVADHLAQSGARHAYVYGGASAVDDVVLSRARQLLSP